MAAARSRSVDSFEFSIRSLSVAAACSGEAIRIGGGKWRSLWRETLKHSFDWAGRPALPPASESPASIPISLEAAIADYKLGIISATALLMFYLRALGIEEGDDGIQISQSEACTILGINRSSFYTAIQRLSDKGFIRKHPQIPLRVSRRREPAIASTAIAA